MFVRRLRDSRFLVFYSAFVTVVFSVHCPAMGARSSGPELRCRVI